MAVTNPYSLLDKNGLAYYHSKVKQEINRAASVAVNVTQSENQTIYLRSTGNLHGGQSSYLYTEDGYGGDSSNYPSGETYYEAFGFEIRIAGDSGYDVGEIVVSGDGVVPNSFVKGTNNVYSVYVFRGGTLNISATPAKLTAEHDITFNYNIPENTSVEIKFTSPKGKVSSQNFTGTGTRTISLPEGTTYRCNMPYLARYNTIPSNGYISGTVSQDTEISFGYTEMSSVTLKIKVIDQDGNSIDCNGCDAIIDIHSEGYNDTATFDSNGEATFTISEYYTGMNVYYNAERIFDSSEVGDNYIDGSSSAIGQYTLTDDNEQTINIVLTAVSAMSPKSVKIKVTDQNGNGIDCNGCGFEVWSDDPWDYTESGYFNSSGEAIISVPYKYFYNEIILNCKINPYNDNLRDNYMPSDNGHLNTSEYDSSSSSWVYYHIDTEDYFNNSDIIIDITFTNATQRIYMNAVDEDTGETLLADYEVIDNYTSSSDVNISTENGLHYFDGLVGREYEISIELKDYPSGTYSNNEYWSHTRYVDGSNTQQEIAEFEQDSYSTKFTFVDRNNNPVQGSYSYYTKNSINVQSSTVSGTGEEVDISHKSRDTIHIVVDASGFQRYEADFYQHDFAEGQTNSLTLDEVV